MILKQPYLIEELHRMTTLHIYLPDDYDQSDQRYPVMYMLDGHNLFCDEDATYGKSWGLEAFLSTYEKPFIIVGIECDHEGNNRLHEYCPYPQEHSFLGPLKGNGELFMHWLVNTLKPMIDMRFRTWPSREATGIGGSSMGGLMAYYGVIRYNRIFSKAACLSPSLILCAKELEEEVGEDWLHPDTRLYLSIGDQEMSRDRQTLYSYLDHFASITKPALSQINIIPDGKHNEASWEAQNKMYFDYLWY